MGGIIYGKETKKRKSQKPSQVQGYDYVINTDGACAGNPGKIGIGGIIKKYPEQETIATFSEAAGQGTNNEAEYKAVIRALSMVKAYQPESVLLRTDSQLVVCQLSGEYGVNHAHLARLCNQVKKLMNEIGQVSITWISRDYNSEADALASKAIGMAQAVIEGDKIIHWNIDPAFMPDEKELIALPELKPECEMQLKRIMVINAKFKDFMTLKSGGIDKYSRAKTGILKQFCDVRFGPTASQWLSDATGDLESEYGKSALRWAARGLPPDLALKKVAVDMEVRANVGKKKSVNHGN